MQKWENIYLIVITKYYSFFPSFIRHFWNAIQDMGYLWFKTSWQHPCPKHVIQRSVFNSYYNTLLVLRSIPNKTLKFHFKIAKMRSEWQEKWSLLRICKTHVIMHRKDVVKTNLRLWEYLLHIVDWTVWNSTTLKELQPLNCCFFWKPKNK